jgi:hypothetical protein
MQTSTYHNHKTAVVLYKFLFISGNQSTSVEPTILHSYQLDMQTDVDLIKKYRSEVARTGVMLLNDLDSVPSRLAMAFHYFCDEGNPLEAKTAIFFTLNMAKCSNTAGIFLFTSYGYSNIAK